MEHVDFARNVETVDALSGPARQPQPPQRELSEIERHHFSLISPVVTELTALSPQAYVGIGQPTGVAVNSADDSFRIAGNGVFITLWHCKCPQVFWVPFSVLVSLCHPWNY